MLIISAEIQTSCNNLNLHCFTDGSNSYPNLAAKLSTVQLLGLYLCRQQLQAKPINIIINFILPACQQ